MIIAFKRSALGVCHYYRRQCIAGAGHVSYSSRRDDGTTRTSVASPEKAHSETQIQRNLGQDDSEKLGSMAQRLQEATEEALLTGGRAGRQAVEYAGFSEELKEKLMSKVLDAKFKRSFGTELNEAGFSSKSGVPGDSTFGAHLSWTGEERTEDAVLRMLQDSKKTLKPELRAKYQPGPIDTRLRRTPVLSPGQKAASARDRANVYSGLGMKNSQGLSDKEKDEMKKQLRDRFQPDGRTGPIAISAIASMANERIEDAMARGQFKNIHRGTGVKHDAHSSNPFVDTTEYLMNRMVQRQDLVPPWIEKQQELVREVNNFRSRLRSDWKRHAARMISSEGGSVLEHMKRAELYAAAEKAHNPRRQRSSDQIAVSSAATDDPVMSTQLEQVEDMAAAAASSSPTTEMVLQRPFRDAAWERAEAKYLTLAVEKLNTMTRSYNLMAPDLAKKPYFSLKRELDECYAAVAPLLAGEIRSRAVRISTAREGNLARQRGGGSGVVNSFIGQDTVKIHVEANGKTFGLREWWRDLWKK